MDPLVTLFLPLSDATTRRLLLRVPEQADVPNRSCSRVIFWNFVAQFSDFHFFGRIIKSVHSVVVLGDVGDGVELLLVLEVLLSCVVFF